jgi:hypothetical protein
MPLCLIDKILSELIFISVDHVPWKFLRVTTLIRPQSVFEALQIELHQAQIHKEHDISF